MSGDNIRRYRVAVIPGVGIGKEVIPATAEVLRALARQDGGFELKIAAAERHHLALRFHVSLG